MVLRFFENFSVECKACSESVDLKNTGRRLILFHWEMNEKNYTNDLDQPQLFD